MVQPTIYKPSVYNGNGVYKNGASGGGGGGSSDLPIVGDLEHEWNFKDSFTDTIGGVTATQKNPAGNTGLGFPKFNYNHGIFLNVLCKVKDYLEIKFSSTVYNTNQYIRLINKSSSKDIDDSSAFVIGPSSSKWASYFNTWYADLANYELINKVGIYLKTNTTMDLFLDDILVKENFANDWGTKNVSKNKYALGCSVTSYTDSNITLGAIRARIYRNAERI